MLVGRWCLLLDQVHPELVDVPPAVQRPEGHGGHLSALQRGGALPRHLAQAGRISLDDHRDGDGRRPFAADGAARRGRPATAQPQATRLQRRLERRPLASRSLRRHAGGEKTGRQTSSRPRQAHGLPVPGQPQVSKRRGGESVSREAERMPTLHCPKWIAHCHLIG